MISFLAGARRGLDNAVHRSWQQSVNSTGTTAGRMLAWAVAADGRFVIAGTGALSIGSSPDDHHASDDHSGDHDHVPGPDAGWQHIGWHQIERGGFDADNSTLRWTLYPAGDATTGPGDNTPDEAERSGALVLEQPGRVPLVFRDRVSASILVEQFVPLADRPTAPGRRLREPGVIISGRRDLGNQEAPIVWHASLPQGIGWDTPGIAELAAESTAQLRSEYDPNA